MKENVTHDMTMNTDPWQILHHCGTSLTEQISYFVMVHVPTWVASGAVFVISCSY